MKQSMKHYLKIFLILIAIAILVDISISLILSDKSKRPTLTKELLSTAGKKLSVAPKTVPSTSPSAQKTTIQAAKLASLAKDLKVGTLEEALKIYNCATKLNIKHRNYLVLIDFTKPSNQKRLWLFDLNDNKLLYHELVAHGVNSGLLYATQFSNRVNSRMSSIGLYTTGTPYKGGVGDALKLHGQEKGFNDNAFQRTIVFHGSWYVTDDFVKKYGRAGRSWGCPAVNHDLAKPIIDAINNGALLLIYYPDKKWLSNSRFLHCPQDHKMEKLKGG